jgi:deoxyribonuclease V
MTLRDRRGETGAAPAAGSAGPPQREARSRFAEAAPVRPAPDQIDVVLGQWESERPQADLAPVAVTARVSRLAQILQQRMERNSTKLGLDWGQFLVLAALRGAGPPFRMSPRELHRLLLLSPAAVTNRLYRLEAKGLIERTADPTDRRSLPVILTVQGLSTIDRAMTACVEGERGLLSSVDPGDLETTLRTLRQLLVAYEEYPSRRRRRRTVSLAGDELRVAPAPEPLAVVTEAAPEPDAAVRARDMWPSTHRDLERLQRSLARRVEECEPWQWTGAGEPAIAGVFVTLPTSRLREESRDIAWAAAVVMEGHSVVATATTTRRLVRPYQAGYLSLTIGPILEDVVAALSVRADIILVNAAGRDHVRGAGLAIQLGAAVDVPTVGVTEHPDIGEAHEPGTHRGDWTPVRIDNRLVGFRIRTLSKANPVMAHAAWRTAPETARDAVLRTTGRQRMPEPLQRARELSRRLRTEYEGGGTGMRDGIHG